MAWIAAPFCASAVPMARPVAVCTLVEIRIKSSPDLLNRVAVPPIRVVCKSTSANWFAWPAPPSRISGTFACATLVNSPVVTGPLSLMVFLNRSILALTCWLSKKSVSTSELAISRCRLCSCICRLVCSLVLLSFQTNSEANSRKNTPTPIRIIRNLR